MKDLLELLSRARPLVLLSSWASVAFACGGQAGHDGAQSPAVPTPTASSSSSANAPPSGASTATTTTTETLADAGDRPGSKLPETRAATSGSASAGAAPKPHDHDPGRGLDDINAIVKAHRDEAQACYERALADHPGIEGDLIITWTIDPKGNVTQTASDSSRSQITEPTAISCVSDIIKRIQFAASPGGFETKASYPFKFHHHRAKQPQ